MSHKVVYKPEPPHQGDYIILIQDESAYKRWLDGDKTIPVVDFVDSFDIFFTHGQGAQGQLDRPSRNDLDSTFGTTDKDKIMNEILVKGHLQKEKAIH